MKFAQYPEPFVSGATVRAHMGDVSDVTLWRWCKDGCPYHVMRNGRRMYKLSEVETWMFGKDQDAYGFKRTSNTGEGAA
jgi:predicted site-specific integrase-resolvase